MQKQEEKGTVAVFFDRTIQQQIVSQEKLTAKLNNLKQKLKKVDDNNRTSVACRETWCMMSHKMRSVAAQLFLGPR